MLILATMLSELAPRVRLGSSIHFALLHEADSFRHGDVAEHIARHGDDVGFLAGLDGSGDPLDAEQYRRRPRGA